MAEHSAVNRRVVGSSPTWGAIRDSDVDKNVGVPVFLAFCQKLRLAGFAVCKMRAQELEK